MLRSYIIGTDGEAVEWQDLAAVYAEYGRRDRDEPGWRRLRVTDLFDATGQPCRVSTVFIGLCDQLLKRQAPRPWQTIVFGGQRDSQCRRWPTREEALAGHEALVAVIAAEAEIALGEFEE